MNQTCQSNPERETITFNVMSTPAGWRIVGVDSLTISTLYLSREAAVAQAQSMAAVMVAHGQPAKVVVEGEETSR